MAVTTAGSLETQVITLVCPSKQETCPEAEELPCPRDCSIPNGKCDTMTQTCACSDGWGGVDCSEYMCNSTSCLPDTSQEFEEAQGTCQNGVCECAEGYTGIDCRVEEPQCTRDCALLVCNSQHITHHMHTGIFHRSCRSALDRAGCTQTDRTGMINTEQVAQVCF